MARDRTRPVPTDGGWRGGERAWGEVHPRWGASKEKRKKKQESSGCVARATALAGCLHGGWHDTGGATLRRERRPQFPHHAAPHLPLLPLPRGGLDPAVSRAAADPSCAAATAHARESLSKSGTTGVGSRAVGGAVRGCGVAHPRRGPTARPTRGTQTGAAHVVLRLGDRRASADPLAAQAGTEGQARTATSRSRQPRRPSAFVCRWSRPTPHRFGARRPQGLVPPSLSSPSLVSFPARRRPSGGGDLPRALTQLAGTAAERRQPRAAVERRGWC